MSTVVLLTWGCINCRGFTLGLHQLESSYPRVVSIVVFLPWGCINCSLVYLGLHQLSPSYPGVSSTTVFLPLGCNPRQAVGWPTSAARPAPCCRRGRRPGSGSGCRTWQSRTSPAQNRIKYRLTLLLETIELCRVQEPLTLTPSTCSKHLQSYTSG